MKITISGMENIRYLESVSLSNSVNFIEDFGKLRAWYSRVLDHQVRVHPPHRSKCSLARSPELRPFRFILGDSDRPRIVLNAYLLESLRYVVKAGRQAVNLDYQ